MRQGRTSRAGIALAGLAVALASWHVGMHPPAPGLDASWNAGLSMAVEHGLQFGTEVVFSYGPLGFLQGQYLWYADLGVLALLYSSALHVSFCVALVWALRRALPLALSAVVAFLLVALLPLLELPLLLPALVSLALLERERSARALSLFVLGAATFAAIVSLVKLSTGPVVVSTFLIALVGARAGAWRIAAFGSLVAVELLVIWRLTGQPLANLPDFLVGTWEIGRGYSAAMMREVDVAPWQVLAATVGAAAVAVALVLATWRGRYRDDRARLAGALLMAVAAFTLFKEGMVRTDAAHLSLFFSCACVLWIAVPWRPGEWRWLAGGVALVVVLSLPMRPPGLAPSFNVATNLSQAWGQLEVLASAAERDEMMAAGRAQMKAVYRLDPDTRASLEGQTVAIEPWEAGVAWAYELDWRPPPVFQNYSAYTSRLDRSNAEAIEDPTGPDRLLRENPLLVYPEFDTLGLDGRFPGWDPPAQARAALCHFRPVRTTARWQVLARTPDRCGPAHLIDSREAGPGEPVPVPAPPAGQAVFVRIHEAGVSGLERLTSLLLHARTRRVSLDDGVAYRLIPETAADGLLLRSAPGIEAETVFSPFPQSRTIAVSGSGGELRYEFFAMPVAPPEGPAPRRPS